MSEPPELARCNEHGLVCLEYDSAYHNWCPACKLGLDAKPDEEVAGGSLRQEEFTGRLQAQTLEELVPLMREYLEESNDEVVMWMTHKKWDRDPLPAGYTEQERFIPVLGYHFGSRQKYMTQDKNAQGTIETLRANGFGD